MLKTHMALSKNMITPPTRKNPPKPIIRPLARETGKLSDPTYHLSRRRLRLLCANGNISADYAEFGVEILVALGKLWKSVV